MMSFLSLLLGCNRKKETKADGKTEPWPRFPRTDNPEVKIEPVILDHDFRLLHFFIAPDKKNVYVLSVRDSEDGKLQEGGEPRPGPPEYRDFRLYCLDAKGKIKKHLDMFRTDWMGGGSFGLLEGRLMIRVGDWFLVLDTTQLVIQEKIPVHDSYYVSWKETVMTRDEHQADYLKKFDAIYKKSNGKLLYWVASGEYFVFVQDTVKRRSAWVPMMDEDALLDSLKKKFKRISVSMNPTFVDPNNPTISDGSTSIREVERLPDGTQLVYPNYKERSILQHEIVFGNKKSHFSTTNRDGHALRLGYSDNMLLTMEDGAIWIRHEEVLYRVVSG